MLFTRWACLLTLATLLTIADHSWGEERRFCDEALLNTSGNAASRPKIDTIYETIANQSIAMTRHRSVTDAPLTIDDRGFGGDTAAFIGIGSYGPYLQIGNLRFGAISHYRVHVSPLVYDSGRMPREGEVRFPHPTPVHGPAVYQLGLMETRNIDDGVVVTLSQRLGDQQAAELRTNMTSLVNAWSTKSTTTEIATPSEALSHVEELARALQLPLLAPETPSTSVFDFLNHAIKQVVHPGRQDHALHPYRDASTATLEIHLCNSDSLKSSWRRAKLSEYRGRVAAGLTGSAASIAYLLYHLLGM